MFDSNHNNFWIIFPLYFASLWLLLLVLFSYTSGWRALAQRYRLEAPFDGQIYRQFTAKHRLDRCPVTERRARELAPSGPLLPFQRS